jgi:hypothetical protein
VRILKRRKRPSRPLSAVTVLLAALVTALPVLPAAAAPAAAASAAGTRVGPHHPAMILPVGPSRPVPAVQRQCRPAPRPSFAAGACVAAEEAGAGLPTLEIDAQRMPNIARNIQSALDEGHPGILNRTTNQDLINANRTAACSGFCGSGSPDEYPFASTYQGGAGARIADVPIQEQRIQGGVMSSFYAKYGISDGDPFQVIVTGLWEAP